MTDWHDQAQCRGTDPETFFPAGFGARYLTRIERAKDDCWACQVRLDCLDDALNREGDTAASMRHGIRGGLEPDQRWRVHQQLTERKAAS
ncbi:WhiB family transcriptional regulator [Streptantibioticus silvisoli]|uniref:WhiB family transcriptional regulator n=1 Tax=Streptantibioticus silvisoli TaxID=2705255 RepID=A0ABT6W4W7_9ACTN|nr:WhiB family transcriptional regulator [Streptantibioticus silvisoli]MDI5965801.1 WhiB family transcriptional regulator [Streptantibioticus silvisoli]